MDKKFQIIAHRGASSLCPENTASAFKKALETGADWIETDLRLSSDGIWVVIHDRDISRHGCKKGIVERMTLAELRRYEFGSWFGEQFRGEPLLTLEQACGMILPRAGLILDIKTEGRPAELAGALAGALSRHSSENIILSSFSLGLLDALSKVDPAFKLGYLFHDRPELNARLAGGRKIYSLHPHKSVFSRELAVQAREKRMKTFVWTVNHPAEMLETAETGADGIFTDFPQRAGSFGRPLPVRV